MRKSKVTKKTTKNNNQTISEQIEPDSMSSSFASTAKKQLRQISNQNEITKVNEWLLDQDSSLLVPLCHLTNKDINISKFSFTKGDFKLGNKKLGNSFHRRAKTMASDDSQSSLNKICNPVQISFYETIKRERQSRIHSRGIINVDSCASDKKSKIANIFQAISRKNSQTQSNWRQKKNEGQEGKKKNSILHLPKTSIISKFGVKNNQMNIQKKGKSIPPQFRQLQKRKQFLFLTNILQKERQNIFYPNKAYRSLKIQVKPKSSLTANKS